ncbi:MAG TPA: 50S ribosomal protein L32e [Geobacterales bacterium]|nr:50S ribosomal protein L32e [Geobacterales bacterium]
MDKKNLKRALEIREVQKHKMPDFVRADSWKVKRLENSGWRRPKGLDTKMRIQRKGWPPVVKIGYRKIKIARDLHPSGLKEVLVHNVKELQALDPEIHIVRIASTVGRKKRVEIIDEATKMGLKIANPRI